MKSQEKILTLINMGKVPMQITFKQIFRMRISHF